MSKKRGLTFYKKERKIKSGHITGFLGIVLTIVMAVFAAFVFVKFFGIRTIAVGEGMEPVINEGAYVYYNTLSILVTSPKKGDVIVFLPKGNERSHFYIKRVVGCPGDTIKITDKTLYVNGEKNTVITKPINDSGIAEEEIELGDGEFFCIGDNPSKSEDSRNANVGVVKKEYIIGTVWCIKDSASGKMDLLLKGK